MEERDYYGRRRYPPERYEEDWPTRAFEDEEARYGYRASSGRPYGPWSEEDERYRYEERFGRERPHAARRYGGRREAWGMSESPYEAERRFYGDEPYGPAHSPAHMRGARAEAGWSGYGPEYNPMHARGGRPEAGQGWGQPLEERRSQREPMWGRYVGRGPKGYKRSRERILDDVSERLTRHPDIDATDMEVDVQDDVVVLRGRVYDRQQKRMAEDVAESVSGVRDVRNELDVERGILETLTEAVTGREEERRIERNEVPPERARF